MMRRRKKIINKKNKKTIDKKCKFCSGSEYCSLDVHRIVEGKNGGKYTEFNTVVCCVLCHRKIHSGKIKIDRKYQSTNGWILHYFDENGKEHWD